MMNPEQLEVLEARRMVLLAEIDCFAGAKEVARKRGDAETFLASYNLWVNACDELRTVEKPFIRLAAEERKRRNPPDDPLGV
jgi:hypothetical protein